MVIIIAGTVLCTLFLVTRKEKQKYNVWQILWLAACGIGAVIATTRNEGEWNRTIVTYWAVGGRKESGPFENVIVYGLAQMLVFTIFSYLFSRILNAIIRRIRARFSRNPLPNGEKRRTGTPLRPVCYCCNQPKSRMNGYPSRICGQKICFDCLKRLGFNELFDTDTRLAAYEGREPFHSADDVLEELRRRRKIMEMKTEQAGENGGQPS